MGLRPARTCRSIDRPAFTRFSKKKPRESYVKSMPHNALNITSMGNQKGYYTHRVDLIAEEYVQIRDNALESARMAANKPLENKIPGDYYLFVRVMPHHVIRQVKVVLGAGADRIQKGMKHAWGRPSDRAARVRPGSIIYTGRVRKENLPLMKESFRLAANKLPGKYSIRVTEEIVGTKPEE
ncbi:MAG: 50S ribosomal protein L16 [Candidatus Micrarchaeia archaeon]